MENLFTTTQGGFGSQYKAFLLAPQCPTNDQWVNWPWGNGSYTNAQEPPESQSMTRALSILDQRLRGEETKKLIGIGTASAFYIKQAVQAIKELADRFATRIGDSSFADMVSRAMKREEETLTKRKAAMAARHARRDCRI